MTCNTAELTQFSLEKHGYYGQFVLVQMEAISKVVTSNQIDRPAILTRDLGTQGHSSTAPAKTYHCHHSQPQPLLLPHTFFCLLVWHLMAPCAQRVQHWLRGWQELLSTTYVKVDNPVLRIDASTIISVMHQTLFSSQILERNFLL